MAGTETVVHETRYARSGDVHIAYQVAGIGPRNLVFIPGFIANLELQWEEAHQAAFFSRLASFSRLIRFDKRGTGLSDRDARIPILEERIDDVRAVMDATDTSRAVLMGLSEGGPLALAFAATYPERVEGLLLFTVLNSAPPRFSALGRARHDELVGLASPDHVHVRAIDCGSISNTHVRIECWRPGMGA